MPAIDGPRRSTPWLGTVPGRAGHDEIAARRGLDLTRTLGCQNRRSRGETLVQLRVLALVVFPEHAKLRLSAGPPGSADDVGPALGNVRELDLHVDRLFWPFLRRDIAVPLSLHPPLEPGLAVFAQIDAGDAAEGLADSRALRSRIVALACSMTLTSC